MRQIRPPTIRSRGRKHRSLWSVFAWPLVIATLGIAGLIVALTGDGLRDMLGWLGLAAAIIPLPWALIARRS